MNNRVFVNFLIATIKCDKFSFQIAKTNLTQSSTFGIARIFITIVAVIDMMEVWLGGTPVDIQVVTC
jgi:hypothetical protein